MREAKIIDLQTHHEPFVTQRMLADYWGVSLKTIYRDIRKRALRVYRLPGGAIRIKREDALAYGEPTE